MGKITSLLKISGFLILLGTMGGILMGFMDGFDNLNDEKSISILTEKRKHDKTPTPKYAAESKTFIDLSIPISKKASRNSSAENKNLALSITAPSDITNALTSDDGQGNCTTTVN